MHGLYAETYYHHFNKNNHGGMAYRLQYFTQLVLPYDFYATFQLTWLGRMYTYNGYVDHSPVMDEIALSRAIFNDYAEITVALTNYFLNEIEIEKNSGPKYRSANYYHYNNSAILFRLNFFITKGKKLKKHDRELLMEQDVK